MKEFNYYKKSIDELKKAVLKNDELIVSNVWSDLDNYKEIEEFLLKKGFKIYYKKKVYYKKINTAQKSSLIFRKNKKLIKKMFTEFLSKTSDKDFEKLKKNPEKSFIEDIYSKNPEWNLCAYNLKKQLVGFFSLEYIKDADFGTLLLIYIKDEFRGNNYSIEILKKIEELFLKSNITNWYESTNESNTAMIKAFQRYGFMHKRDLIFFIRKN